MFFASVEICFALNVEKSLIGLVIVQSPKGGKKKIQTKVRTLLGLWLTLNNVQSVENL